ncbi:17723_t:CDS:2, partial [Acaulospora morrowiae]
MQTEETSSDDNAKAQTEEMSNDVNVANDLYLPVIDNDRGKEVRAYCVTLCQRIERKLTFRFTQEIGEVIKHAKRIE